MECVTYAFTSFSEGPTLKYRLVPAILVELLRGFGQLPGKFRNNIVDKKNQLMSLFVFFISLLIVAQHVSGNHVPIIRS